MQINEVLEHIRVFPDELSQADEKLDEEEGIASFISPVYCSPYDLKHLDQKNTGLCSFHNKAVIIAYHLK